jgi:carbamoyl-phosphate synthase large subunit
MKSVGEVMAIGRTFKESLQKALRSLENDLKGFDNPLPPDFPISRRKDIIEEKLKFSNSKTILFVGEAFREKLSTERIHELTGIDHWFLWNIRQIIDEEGTIRDAEEEIKTAASGGSVPAWLPAYLKKIKSMGFSDAKISEIVGVSEKDFLNLRKSVGVLPVFKLVDTCAAEFEAYTPYLYSTYETEDESERSGKKSVIILGAGPNRIGQGIEFDYCCVQSVFALREEGFETIMINCNPETVSTDYDTADKLYFEPLTYEDVMRVIEQEKPEGVIVQFGGQTPLKLAVSLGSAGVNILGTSPESIDIAEDRERFA